MISDPSLIHFACIAKGTTILAEFNSKDAELCSIAIKCLSKTPPFHSTFSHTVRSRTYTFLIDQFFVYFAIYDDKLDTSEGLAFLKTVKDAFEFDQGERKLQKVTSHCYQGEFNPVFHQLLGPGGSGFGLDQGMVSPIGQRLSQSGILHPIIDMPLTSKSTNTTGGGGGGEMTGLKKTKNRLLGEFRIGKQHNNDDNNEGGGGGSGHGIGLSQKNEGGGRGAKKLWKKQVLLVLSLDFFVCVALFGIWLWVCNGFECIANN